MISVAEWDQNSLNAYGIKGLGDTGQTPQSNTPMGYGQQTTSAPDYDTLKQNATDYFLKQGGTQKDVDAYFSNNPDKNYNKLATDAAKWYTDPDRPDFNDPNFTQVGDTRWQRGAQLDQRNQNVAGYFGINAPPPGQGYFGPHPAVTPIGATRGGSNTTPTSAPMSDPSLGIHRNDQPSPEPPAYPQSWLDTYNKLDPETQAQVAGRYGGMSQAQIMRDWEQNVQPQYAPGTTYDQILAGAPTLGGPPNGVAGPSGINGGPRPGGRLGSLSRALGDPGQDYRAHMNDAARAGANTGPYSPGSGVEGKDPWTQPTYDRNGRLVTQGYAQGAPQMSGGRTFTWKGQTYTMPGRMVQGEPVQWQGGKPPVIPGSGLPAQGQSIGYKGGPIPDWLSQANQKFGLKPPGQNARQEDWDKYRDQLAYYAPDISAWYKENFPGQKDPLNDYLGSGYLQTNPLY